jgi:hypothetical protein
MHVDEKLYIKPKNPLIKWEKKREKVDSNELNFK